MKKYIFNIALLAALLFAACDKVSNPYPKAVKTDLDTTIYSGTWSEYVATKWPNFATMSNENPNRNALIEDFTGHNCSFCPAAGAVAHSLHSANPSRVFVASIHASNTTNGISSFQTVNSAQGYTIDFTNAVGLQLGSYFGTTLVNSGFYGNPAGTINRKNDAGEYFSGSGSWSTKVSNVLASPLKVAIKAKVNYYETPKHGLFLHTEIQKIDNSITNELGIVVYVLEDSLVGPQNVQNVFTPNYVHRDIFRGTIDGQVFGRTLTASMLTNGKYYVNYSYILPNQLAPSGVSTTHKAENMHLLIYVYDKTTLEIYQVVKKSIS
jgi:hypothetical protein